MMLALSLTRVFFLTLITFHAIKGIFQHWNWSLVMVIVSLVLNKSFILLDIDAFIGNEVFDTGDAQLFSIFCVNNANELKTIGEQSLTHKEITVAGIIRSISLLMQDLRQSFVPPTNPTLSSLFQYYFKLTFLISNNNQSYL